MERDKEVVQYLINIEFKQGLLTLKELYEKLKLLGVECMIGEDLVAGHEDSQLVMDVVEGEDNVLYRLILTDDQYAELMDLGAEEF